MNGLIIENEESVHTFLAREIAEVEFTHAYSIEEGVKKVNYGFYFIIVGPCTSGSQPTTLDLIKELENTYAVPSIIVGVSGVPDFCEKMKKAGCHFVGDRILMAEKIKEIIKKNRKG